MNGSSGSGISLTPISTSDASPPSCTYVLNNSISSPQPFPGSIGPQVPPYRSMKTMTPPEHRAALCQVRAEGRRRVVGRRGLVVLFSVIGCVPTRGGSALTRIFLRVGQLDAAPDRFLFDRAD